jgi:hypothetical protein
MAYASKLGRARISPSSPSAAGRCDRCGFIVTRKDMIWQYEWRGAALQNTYILVCNRCLDVPQENRRAIVLPADPIPIVQPRVEPYLADETDYRVTTAKSLTDPTTGIPVPQGQQLVTLDGHDRTTQPIGRPSNLAQSAIMPLSQVVHYGPTLSVLSLNSDGFYTVTVTCSTPHNLSTNSQVSVQGAAANEADGSYSVIVTSALAFTYTTINPTPQGGLLTGGTRIWSMLVGIPLGYDQIPQTQNPVTPTVQPENLVREPELIFYRPSNSMYIPIIPF